MTRLHRSKATCVHGRPWYADCLSCEERQVLVPSARLGLHIDDLPIYSTNGPSCFGYLGEDGLMHETVWDADGQIVRERHTPFAIWTAGGAEP